jgi:hypothetical protein
MVSLVLGLLAIALLGEWAWKRWQAHRKWTRVCDAFGRNAGLERLPGEDNDAFSRRILDRLRTP